MPDVVVFANEILNVLVLLGILGLIFTFLIKFYNILSRAEVYDISMSIIILAVGTICYLFIEVGLLLNATQDLEANILEFNFYYWFARVFYILIWVFWFVELILYAAFAPVKELGRMKERQEERMQRSIEFFRF